MRNQLMPSLAAALLIVSTPLVTAQTAPDPSGHWEGSIQAPDRPVPVAIDLLKNSTGEFVAAFTGGDVNSFPLSNVSVRDTAVRFDLIVNGGGTFEGLLSADGTSMAGDFTISQGGFTVAFMLTRAGDARSVAPAKSAAIGKDLEGTWNGSLEADGRTMRVVVTLLNHPDGTSTGSVANLDQGAVEIPVTTITQRALNVTLDVPVVGGTYTAVLSADGSELSGTWTQRSLTTPLVLKRAAR